MGYTSQLKPQVDLPVWEWMRFSPVTSTAISALTAPGTGTPNVIVSASLSGGVSGSVMSVGGNGSNRYMYYLVSSTFYRYDTVSDCWCQLASPPVAPAGVISLKYSSQVGYYGRILSATSGSFDSAVLTGQQFVGNRIRILSGKGAGQERQIVGTGYQNIVETFLATAGSTTTITDSTKTWKPNQWAGYQISITIGTGAGQVRRILYNSNTVLVLQDNTIFNINPWTWGAPLSTAAAANTYGYIESSTVYIDVPWTDIPDETSEFMILSGGIWCVTQAPTSTAGFCLMYYDVAADVWYNKNVPSGMWSSLAAVPCNDTLETLSENPTVFATGSFTLQSPETTGSLFTGTYPVLQDTKQNLSFDTYAGFAMVTYSGSGAGQRRTIIGNSGSLFYINRPFTGIINTSSMYKIVPDYDKLYLTGQNAASLFQYSKELDMWSFSEIYDYGTSRPAAAVKPGWEPIGISTLTTQAGSISSLSSIPTAGGTGYGVNNILTITTGGTNGLARVLSVNETGSVLSVELEQPGSSYTTGTGKATTVNPVGGSGCTLNILSISTSVIATTVNPHYFKLRDTASIKLGVTSPSDYTGSADGVIITGIPTVTTFNYIIPTSPGAFTVAPQSTTLLIDNTKNWSTNEHVGKYVMFTEYIAANTSGPSSLNKITSNTSSSLSITNTGYTPLVGRSKYCICDMRFFGTDTIFPMSDGEGIATSGSTTTLTDTSKNWSKTNIWAGKKIRIIAGAGAGQELFLSSSTSNTLVLSQSLTFNPVPNSSSMYSVEDCYGIATAGAVTTLTDGTQTWPVNFFAGKKVRIAGGTGGAVSAIAANPLEGAIASNTANTLTFATFTTTGPTANITPYAIIGKPASGVSDKLIWAFNQNNPLAPLNKGTFLFHARGGLAAGVIFDRFDIATLRWTTIYSALNAEPMTTGTMYAYDGGDRIYFTNGATGRMYYLDIVTHKIHSFGQIPYGMSTAIIGNRMEVMQTVDGVKFVYLLRHTGTEMWRELIYY